MNLTELTLQVKRDYEKIRDTTLIRLGNEYDRERRKFKIDKKRTYAKVYAFKTAAKNNWLLAIRKKPASEYYKSPVESLMWDALTYFYDGGGLKVLRWTEPVLQVFTAHFFQRYNQRLKLGLTTPVDIIKHYLLHCSLTSCHYTFKNGIIYFIAFAKEGLQLGTVQEGDWVLWRTFVSEDLIRSHQSEMKQQLINKLDTQWMKAVKENKMHVQSAINAWDQLQLLKGRYNPL